MEAESTLRELLLRDACEDRKHFLDTETGSDPLENMEENYVAAVETVKTERDVIIELLETYRRLPCLWETTHKFYNNKRARRKALDMLLDIYKQVDPNTTLAKVRKKVENLRTAFYREWKKIEASKQSGVSEEEFHRPTLWYFPYLVFLKDRDYEVPPQVNSVPKEKIVIMKREDIVRSKRLSETEWIEAPTEVDLSESEFDETLEVPQKRMKRVHSKTVDSQNSIDDSTDAFARAMGMQLKEMTRIQKCIAEKLIAEVIFCGKLEQLTMQSCINVNN